MDSGWLARSLSSKVHRATFERVVAPALADLDFECREADAWSAARAHVGLLRALVGALSLDVRSDVRELAGELPLLIKLALVQAASQGFPLALAMHTISVGQRALLVSCIFVLSLVGLCFCYWPTREVTPAVGGNGAVS